MNKFMFIALRGCSDTHIHIRWLYSVPGDKPDWVIRDTLPPNTSIFEMIKEARLLKKLFIQQLEEKNVKVQNHSNARL